MSLRDYIKLPQAEREDSSGVRCAFDSCNGRPDLQNKLLTEKKKKLDKIETNPLNTLTS